MEFVQFRIHPSVGIARMGNSVNFYSLTSEIPMFLQEEFPKIRHRPVRRHHPNSASWLLARTAATLSVGSLSAFNPFDPAEPRKDHDRYKEGNNVIIPQGARFRIFAYVYRSKGSRWPKRVVEVSAEEADIEWEVALANRKKGNGEAVVTSADINSGRKKQRTTNVDDVALRTQAIGKAGRPNLAAILLERDENDPRKPNGRLHVVGNVGESDGPASEIGTFSTLWFDKWDDSAADGEVTANIRPRLGPLRTKLGLKPTDELKYLKFGVESPASASGNPVVPATPAWCVVGLPNYVPDLGHFVSLWDIAFAQAEFALKQGLVNRRDGNHKHIRKANRVNRYKWFDYRVHIQPQLTLFSDLNELSSMTRKSTGAAPNPATGTGHKKTPAFLDARAQKSDLESLKKPLKLKATRNELVKRLRSHKTLYRKKRYFLERERPRGTKKHYEKRYFPRFLGRRVSDPGGPGKLWDFPHEVQIIDGAFEPGKTLRGSLRAYYTPGKRVIRPKEGLCGRQKFDPGGSAVEKDPIKMIAGSDANLKDHLVDVDDQYWPATEADMPLLRELAYTEIQDRHFRRWSKGRPRNADNIWGRLVNAQLEAAFNNDTFADRYVEEILKLRPNWAPALIDLAHLGSMLGGSFLPGIEVGREGGKHENWCILDGGTKSFPDIRFQPIDSAKAKHDDGTLTKDLAIPWQQDFSACDETYWPTSRPGEVLVRGVPPAVDSYKAWLFNSPGTKAELKSYWVDLGFVRRKAGTNDFEEQEANRP